MKLSDNLKAEFDVKDFCKRIDAWTKAACELAEKAEFKPNQIAFGCVSLIGFLRTQYHMDESELLKLFKQMLEKTR